MKCPFCHEEVSDGKFCSNCSKPLHPKWYQKNSPLTVTIMIVSIIFFIGCLCFSMSISKNDNETNNSSITTETSKTNAQKTYSSVLEEYKVKLQEATPVLIEEYKQEVIQNTNGLNGLAEILNEKISELAEISTSGMSEMAELMYTTGSGNYSEYEEWAGKLQDIYTQ